MSEEKVWESLAADLTAAEAAGDESMLRQVLKNAQVLVRLGEHKENAEAVPVLVRLLPHLQRLNLPDCSDNGFWMYKMDDEDE